MTIKPSLATPSMLLTDEHGKTNIDLCAGLTSCLGHHPTELKAAIAASSSLQPGPMSALLSADWHFSLGVPFSDFGRCFLTSSANEANELALRIVRSSFGVDRYRVITLLGSNHGDTYLLRSANGSIEQQGYDGPVAAGFRHVMPGDVNAIEKLIDSTTAAICLSPVNWNQGGEAFDTDYLVAVEALCRKHDLNLVMDETWLPTGVGGPCFFYQRASITPDVVTLSAGWLAGFSGGMTLVSPGVLEQVANRKVVSGCGSLIPENCDLPLQRAVVTATANTIAKENLYVRIDETADAWAAMLDELSEGFDFIRGCVHAGLWTTIEFDLPAADVARAAEFIGLRFRVTGETTMLICPPINVTGDQLLEAIELLRRTMESVERETASS